MVGRVSIQYEGGMNVTSAVIRGIFALADHADRKPDITEVGYCCVADTTQ